MTEQAILDIVQQTLIVIITVSAPPLLMGLIVGILVSMFQTITSIQEPTLAFIPKIVAVLLSLIFFGPFMLTTLEQYFINLFSQLQQYMMPR